MTLADRTGDSSLLLRIEPVSRQITHIRWHGVFPLECWNCPQSKRWQWIGKCNGLSWHFRRYQLTGHIADITESTRLTHFGTLHPSRSRKGNQYFCPCNATGSSLDRDWRAYGRRRFFSEASCASWQSTPRYRGPPRDQWHRPRVRLWYPSARVPPCRWSTL
jgi:hypothetical protein